MIETEIINDIKRRIRAQLLAMMDDDPLGTCFAAHIKEINRLCLRLSAEMAVEAHKAEQELDEWGLHGKITINNE